MKRSLAFIMAIFAALLLAGCGGKGSSAPAPSNVKVVEGDTIATVTWDMQPGVEYWIYKAAGTNITPQNCSSMPECTTTGVTTSATSPTVFSGLTNGTQYSFTINGRISGGPGGPGSPSITIIPRLAGNTWTAPASGVNAISNDLHGVAYGGVLVATGTNGSLYSSQDGISWAPPSTSPVPISPRTNFSAETFNAAAYSAGKYLVVGTSGVILTSTDAAAWAQQPVSGVAAGDFYSVTGNGSGQFVATGANGASGVIATFDTAIDGTNWIVQAPNSSKLNAVTYGYGGTSTGYFYAAVGTAGAILTSTNGTTWTPISPSPSPVTNLDLRGIVYGAGIFVAVGANGALVTSNDGATWTFHAPQPSSPITATTMLNAVTYGRQFVAVADSGQIYTSTDGLTWTTAAGNTNTSQLYAVTPYSTANSTVAYAAVGASGVTLLSK